MGQLTAVSWSPYGQRIVSGSDDHTLIVWDASTGQPERTLQGHTDEVRAVSWCPDGQRIVSGSDDHTLIVWDASTGQPERTLPGHTYRVTAVSWSPDGQRIVSGSNDRTLIVWEVSSGEILARFPAECSVPATAWHPARSDLLVVGLVNGWVRQFQFHERPLRPGFGKNPDQPRNFSSMVRSAR
jgi:WD40 repeat protein